MANAKANQSYRRGRVVNMLAQLEKVVNEIAERYCQGDGHKIGHHFAENGGQPEMSRLATSLTRSRNMRPWCRGALGSWFCDFA